MTAPEPRFDPARLEREVNDLEEFTAEVPLQRPDTEGVELVIERDNHAEPPAADRGYRNLNE